MSRREYSVQAVKKIILFSALSALMSSISLEAFALPRDKVQTARFRRDHPCPATGHIKGSCPGYNIDHKKPLMTGGADHPSNMQWVKTADHKKKTKQDIANCKAGPVCLHRRLKKS
jgi:hypothetical protein